MRAARLRALAAGVWRGISPGSIATRMVLFAILLVTLTAALIGALSYTRARRALETEARVRLTLLARDVAEHLHRELQDRVADITNWAHLEVMRAVLYQDVDKELAQFIRQILQGRQIYRAILCLADNGQPVASAGEIETLAPRAHPGQTQLSIVSDKENPGEGLLQLETDVFNPQQPGTRIGTLVVLLDSRRVLETIDASVQGAEGRASLTVRSLAGDVVLERAGFAPRSVSAAPAAPAAVLTGVAAVGSLSLTGGPDLEVVVAEPASVALAAVTALRAALFRLGAIVLGIGSALGALMAWRISLPIRRLTGTVRQITQRRQLEAPMDLPAGSGEVGVLASAFRAMMESLAAAQSEALVQSRLAFLGEVAANIAHEVRTPLSVLKTSAQLLARAELPASEQRDLALMVAAEVDRLNRVVTGLVDLARPKPVRYRMEFVDEILGRAITFFTPMAAKNGVQIVQAIEGSGLRARCSADQLYQVLLNLIHNAMQAMEGAGLLTVRCRREDAWIVIDVEDTGPGFSSAILPRAFSPFCTTKPDGTGLGLAISKRIVEEHGGTIAAENRPAGGARVRLRLPPREERA